MCGRFTLTVNQDELSEHFGCPIIVPDYRPRYNVAPSQVMPVLVGNHGEKHIEMMKWGLVPYWAKDGKIGNKLFNARMETVAEKPTFRDSLGRRRCIVPADGYYEWMKEGKSKQPLRIVLENGGLFGFAGLWDSWINEEGKTLLTFSILTTAPVESISYIHNRMPFILRRKDEEYWLRENRKMTVPEAAEFLSRLKPEESLRAYPVSGLVNSPAHESPELIEQSL